MFSRLILPLTFISICNARQGSNCFTQSGTCNIDDQKFPPFNISYQATSASACQSLCLSQNTAGANAYVNRRSLTVYCQLALVKEGSICKLYYQLNILGNQVCSGPAPIGGNSYGGNSPAPPQPVPYQPQIQPQPYQPQPQPQPYQPTALIPVQPVQPGYGKKLVRVERHLIKQSYSNQQPLATPSYNPQPTQPAQPGYGAQPQPLQPGQPSIYGALPAQSAQSGCFDGPGGQCSCYTLNSGCPGYCQGPNGGGGGPVVTGTANPLGTTVSSCFTGPTQQEVVGNTIQHYFGGTPGFADGTLAKCQQLCQANTACLSITFYTDAGPGLPANCDLHDKSCNKEPAACAPRTDAQYFEKTC